MILLLFYFLVLISLFKFIFKNADISIRSKRNVIIVLMFLYVGRTFHFLQTGPHILHTEPVTWSEKLQLPVAVQNKTYKNEIYFLTERCRYSSTSLLPLPF